MLSRALAAGIGVLAAVGAARAASDIGQPAGVAAAAERRTGEAPLQLAQGYDYDVYIDQHGREIVVDAYTGEVVAIRPGREPDREAERRRERTRQLGRRTYDFTDPADVERFRRDREAVLGIREPADERGTGYRNDGGDDALRLDPDGFPEAPGVPGRGDERVLRAPLDEPLGEESFDDGELGEEEGLDGDREDESSIVSLPERDSEPEDPASALPRLDSGGIAPPSMRGASIDVVRFQVLLDRNGASPGVIDGRIGDNVNKAIDAYQEIAGQRLRTYDTEWVEEALEATGGPALTEYTITSKDAAGPYIASVPEDYGDKAQLENLGYTSVAEQLAERFHMDEGYLTTLNPDANFNRPGTVITVASAGKPLEAKVSRLEADKAAKQVRAYDEDGRLVAAYPATIGSEATPSPAGTHEVERIAFDPEYTYNPKINFKQGDNDDILKIPPGPNGPVGSIWIALSKRTYGIHGTPEPSKIGKSFSNGCVRLTNWDAQELAGMVEKGVTVTFVE